MAHYTAVTPALPLPRADKRAAFLRALGAAVRKRRSLLGLTLKALAGRAEVSERFLTQLEGGDGNISVARLQDVAEALGTTAADLLVMQPAPAVQGQTFSGVVALLGLRGAGKSSLGPEVAARLGVPFVELDSLVAREAGMPVGTIFEMHGEAFFRRLEHQVLRAFLEANEAAVLATGGAIVTSKDSFGLLRERAVTVWLKAKAKDHWERVVRQGDTRPMTNRANAMAELKALLSERRPLYARADHVVDTSRTTLAEAADLVVAALRSRGFPGQKTQTRRNHR